MSEVMPLYETIYHEIVTDIYISLISPQSNLPSLNELSQKYHVGRNTIRHAIQLLLENGYIEKTKNRQYRVIYDLNEPYYKEQYINEIAQRKDAMHDVFYNMQLLLPSAAAYTIRVCSDEDLTEICKLLDLIIDSDFSNDLELYVTLNHVYMCAFEKAGNPMITNLFESMFRFIRIPMEQKTKGHILKFILLPLMRKYLRQFKATVLKRDSKDLHRQVESFCKILDKSMVHGLKKIVSTTEAKSRYEFNWTHYEYSYEVMIGTILSKAGLDYQYGESLPSYQELADQSHVSLKTSRTAIAKLAELGMVDTANGKKAVLTDNFETTKAILLEDPYLRGNIMSFFAALHFLLITAKDTANTAIQCKPKFTVSRDEYANHHLYIKMAVIFEYVYGAIPSSGFQNIYKELKRYLAWGSLVKILFHNEQITAESAADAFVEKLYSGNLEDASIAFEALIAQIYILLRNYAKQINITVPFEM